METTEKFASFFFFFFFTGGLAILVWFLARCCRKCGCRVAQDGTPQYMRVLWNPDHTGGFRPGIDDWPTKGWNHTLIPITIIDAARRGAGLDSEAGIEADAVGGAFESWTGHPAHCIGYYSDDEMHDEDGIRTLCGACGKGKNE